MNGGNKWLQHYGFFNAGDYKAMQINILYLDHSEYLFNTFVDA